jgi:signal peptidase II
MRKVRRGGTLMKLNRWMICLPAAALLILADQAVKRWVTEQRELWLSQGGGPSLPGLIGLTYVENRGAAFGILQNARWFFVGLMVVVTVGIIWALVKNAFNSVFADCALTLVMSGAVGNGIDRAVSGYVVDYIDFLFIRFAVFNFADICVVCGGILFVAYTLFIARSPEKKDDAVDSDSPA